MTQETILTGWDAELAKALGVAKKILEQRAWRQSIRENTIFSAFEVGKLAQIGIDWVSSDTTLKTVDELIHDFGIEFFPVREDGRFIGYVKHEKFRAMLLPQRQSHLGVLSYEALANILDEQHGEHALADWIRNRIAHVCSSASQCQTDPPSARPDL